ncbi:hypothetical protein BJD55_gp071 [Gordonia phage Yvonnetastic]|uniref:Uncharacterized protein n=1 Tax=Gordonia phage Yvonnetastic TaxID=1821566 RepID=A0A142K9B2_9CAUD|nr:hypothetical protein BJD55_gp071 [Gordonia phage Yvonnetastic]AMS02695.1 hypothetical protein SEA_YVONNETASTIC_151 [Gordonia phage Yvonnetastic]
MSRGQLSEEEFLEVIAAKGGALEALDYGLHYSDCENGDLQVAWMSLEQDWITFRRALARFEDEFDIEPL